MRGREILRGFSRRHNRLGSFAADARLTGPAAGNYSRGPPPGILGFFQIRTIEGLRVAQLAAGRSGDRLWVVAQARAFTEVYT